MVKTKSIPKTQSNVISNRVVVTTGKDGTTPHINPVTNNWMIGTYDTGYKAGYKDGELTSMMIYETKFSFPVIGTSNVLYVAANEANTIYRWDNSKTAYVALMPEINVIECGGAN